jgi:hypothetical protein
MNPVVAFEPMPFVSFLLNALCPANNFQSSLGLLAILFSLMAQKHLWFSLGLLAILFSLMAQKHLWFSI